MLRLRAIMPGGLPNLRMILLPLSINHHRTSLIFIVSLSLAIASLACQIDIGGPARPGDPIVSDQAQATEVAESWSQAIRDAVTSGQVMVLFNESQITGFFKQRMNADQNALIQDPQVYLREGQIQVYGILEQGIFKSTALIRIEPVVDAEGRLSLQLAEISVGPIPAPAFLMESISAVITEALTGSIGSLATGMKLTSVAISNGEMSIVGEIR